MDTPVTHAQHEEFVKRMESENRRLSDEDKRQNRRIDELEKAVRQIGELTTAIKTLAVNMEGMVKEQEQQGRRLEVLEGRDGERWRQVTGYAVTAVVSIVLGFIFAQIGM